MRMKFLDRDNERARLMRTFSRREGSLCCLYGRRRCGKSRLIGEVLPKRSSVYYVGDEREPSLQRAALASACADLLPGFDRVTYPDWASLFERWWREAPSGTVLALDEFPNLASSSRELPSILQKLIDRHPSKTIHLVIAGSSQRMMQGLVLDATAPLYGRAREIINVEPLGAGWLGSAFGFTRSIDVVEAYALWGGIPLYWELASDYRSSREAMEDLVLDPMGVLHAEPHRLLLDDIRETAQSASVLALIAQGCNRISEIAARMEKPVTSLTRPLSRLLDLGLVRREQPFKVSQQSSKKTLYRIDDPFLAFWFRYVEPNRSRLEAGKVQAVAQGIEKDLPVHRAEIWEALVRRSVPRLSIDGREWGTANRWWGGGLDKEPLEIDVVAESVDGKAVLVGEVKWTLDARELDRARYDLHKKTERLPLAERYDRVIERVFAANVTGRSRENLIAAGEVLSALK
ncbi:MAG: ATP-binding protein [Candidatus Krumholzibacteriia bacterium]